MTNLIKHFKNDVYRDTVILDNDGYIGIPVELAVLYNKKLGDVVPGANGTPIILYIMNTAIERIGTAEDSDIVASMLERGYAVVLLDYKSSALAVPPALDYSTQGIRRRIIDARQGDALSFFGEGKFIENFIVPAGYDVELSNPYWAFDKHGADGILEKITEIWNNDFKGTKAEELIKWTDNSGKRKKTVTARDGSDPVWCNKKGEQDENGEYIKLKYTYADDILDCVKPNGTPLDLNLYMHLIYPKKPKNKVPVMCLSSSTEHLASGSASADRPHLNGFLFRGYAGVIFDYGYTPMARVDHYGYFDGYPKAGYVTGDNATYSMSFYNDKRIFTAAMRYIRYLALSDKRFAFDTEKIGVYGNSKGAWMTFLGEKNPEKLSSKRILAEHHDETRYEAGKIETIGIIRGGEEQPWLKYQEIDIKSEAEFIYSSCGGLGESITAEHCPMFISCNRTDSSCYTTSSAMLSSCREYNVPTMFVDIPLPHTIAYGNDLGYGFDAYTAFFDFAGYYLKSDAVKVVGIKENINTLPYLVRIKFSGAVSESEIKKITLCSSYDTVSGEWKGEYGGVEWVFVPENLDYNTEYTLNVPENLKGDNGRRIENAVSYKFVSPKTARTLLSSNYTKDGAKEIYVASESAEGRKYLELEVTNDGYNRVTLTDADGNQYAYVNTHGKGRYRIDITDITALPEKLILETGNSFDKIVYENDFIKTMNGIEFGKRAIVSLSKAPDGTPSVMLSGFKTVTEHPSEEFYIYPDTAMTFTEISGKTPLSVKDMGRTFNISMKIYDTTSRFLRVEQSHATLMEKSSVDYYRQSRNILTKAGEWIDVNFEYTVYELMYFGFEEISKSMTITAYGNGNADMPLYVSDVKSTEKLTDVKIGRVYIVTEEEPKTALPYGQCDIICEQSPWLKK